MAEQPALLVKSVTQLLLTQSGNTTPPTHASSTNAQYPKATPVKKCLTDIDYQFFKHQLIASFKARGLFHIIDGSTKPEDIEDLLMNLATNLIVTAITRTIKNSPNFTYPFGIHQIDSHNSNAPELIALMDGAFKADEDNLMNIMMVAVEDAAKA